MFAFYVVTDTVKWRLKVMQIEIPKRGSDDLTNSFEARKRVCCLYIATNKQQVYNKSGNYKNASVCF